MHMYNMYMHMYMHMYMYMLLLLTCCCHVLYVLVSMWGTKAKRRARRVPRPAGRAACDVISIPKPYSKG